jgi:hypothetical protein
MRSYVETRSQRRLRDIIISGTLKITAGGKVRLNATIDIAASTAGVVAV